MAGNSKLAGLAMIIAGILLGIVYPFLLIYLDRERVIDLIRYTVAAASIAIGAFLGAVGVLIVRGFRPSERPEDTG